MKTPGCYQLQSLSTSFESKFFWFVHKSILVEFILFYSVVYLLSYQLLYFLHKAVLGKALQPFPTSSISFKKFRINFEQGHVLPV